MISFRSLDLFDWSNTVLCWIYRNITCRYLRSLNFRRSISGSRLTVFSGSCFFILTKLTLYVINCRIFTLSLAFAEKFSLCGGRKPPSWWRPELQSNKLRSTSRMFFSWRFDVQSFCAYGFYLSLWWLFFYLSIEGVCCLERSSSTCSV